MLSMYACTGPMHLSEPDDIALNGINLPSMKQAVGFGPTRDVHALQSDRLGQESCRRPACRSRMLLCMGGM